MTNKIAMHEWTNFMRRYLAKEWPNQRLGQAWLNVKFPAVADPDLFYCTDFAKADAMILDRYVDANWE
jgi:hypothetical protein